MAKQTDYQSQIHNSPIRHQFNLAAIPNLPKSANQCSYITGSQHASTFGSDQKMSNAISRETEKHAPMKHKQVQYTYYALHKGS